MQKAFNFPGDEEGLPPLSEIRIPIVSAGEVSLFSEEGLFTQEQLDRAAASLATFVAQLPGDERAVITHLLLQAADAATSS